MRFEYEGMSLWYGTADAPAPEGNVQAGTQLTITVGVKPWNAGNHIVVLYRVNHGSTEQITARWMRNDTRQQAQYFRAAFPSFRAGDVVEYLAICRRAGRQIVPAPAQAVSFSSSFSVRGVIQATQELAKAPEPQAISTGLLPYLRSGDGGNGNSGSPGNGGSGQIPRPKGTGTAPATCADLLAQRKKFQTRLQNSPTDADRQGDT